MGRCRWWTVTRWAAASAGRVQGACTFGASGTCQTILKTYKPKKTHHSRYHGSGSGAGSAPNRLEMLLKKLCTYPTAVSIVVAQRVRRRGASAEGQKRGAKHNDPRVLPCLTVYVHTRVN